MTDLPPLDQPQSYVVVGPDDQRGPYTLELLVEEVVAGRLNDNTPVWWPGLADWTTMSAHPGVAAEIARRRGAPDPSAQVPFAAPAPAPVAQAPAAPAPVAPAEPGYPAGQPAAGDPVGQAQAQDPFSVGDQGSHVAPGSTAGAEGVIAGPDDRGTFGVPEGSTSGEAIEVPAVDITNADFNAVDDPVVNDGFRASGPGEGIDPIHAEAFSDLIRRSRARADAASIVADVDSKFVAAVAGAAAAEGFSARSGDPSSEGDGRDSHDLSYASPDGRTLTVHLGRVHGHDLALGDAAVPFEVALSSTSYVGELQVGTGEHGEVVVSAAEGEVGASAEVDLTLGLGDYLDGDYEVDSDALQRDVRAVVLTLIHRLGG